MESDSFCVAADLLSPTLSENDSRLLDQNSSRWEGNGSLVNDDLESSLSDIGLP